MYCNLYIFQDGKLLADMEIAKEKREKEERDKQIEAEKEAIREANRKRAQDIKKEDRRMVESMQRDARVRRCKQQIKKLKKKWEKYW